MWHESWEEKRSLSVSISGTICPLVSSVVTVKTQAGIYRCVYVNKLSWTMRGSDHPSPQCISLTIALCPSVWFVVTLMHLVQPCIWNVNVRSRRQWIQSCLVYIETKSKRQGLVWLSRDLSWTTFCLSQPSPTPSHQTKHPSQLRGHDKYDL